MQQQPAWLGEAWRELGQREVIGSGDNPRIVAMFRDAGVGAALPDETAWCAAFVGACLKRAGHTGTGSLQARSYMDFGDAIDPTTGAAPLGSIVVLRRGAVPALGHVGFLVGDTATSLMLLGGNQSDGVSVAAFARGDLLGVRWPRTETSTQQTARAAPQPDDDRFQTALAHVLDMEGGWTDDPADPGGPTNLGLTLTDLAAWHGVALDGTTRAELMDELRRIDVAAASPIYRERYWLPSRSDALPAALALMHFDCAVNQGLGRASRFLQEAVGAEADGEIGPLTLAAATVADATAALSRYAELRRASYRSLATFDRFGRGWFARVDRTLARAQAIEAAGATASPSSRSSKGAPTMTTSDPAPATTAPASVPPATATSNSSGSKWWGQSMTVWGALITAAATVLPALGPIIGVDLSAETIRQIGGQAGETVRALAGLAGTIMAIYGRSRAAEPLVRRDFSLRL